MDHDTGRVCNSLAGQDVMSKNKDKTNREALRETHDATPPGDEEAFANTKVISRGKFTEKIYFAERAYFEILRGDGRNEIIELGDGDVIVGRSPECDIRLAVDSVSRKHARVIFRNEDYHIEDLNSTNGVYVNGVRVVKCVLRNNDQVEIGGVKIIFNEEKTLKGRG